MPGDCVRCVHPEDHHVLVKPAPRRLRFGEQPEPPSRGKCGRHGCQCQKYQDPAPVKRGLDPRLERFKRR